ncbi:conserved hypothetical protein [Enterobacterales bacterium 8AC]|nr:conserved hypothetical protein [Enterobacterales bacterium 8AC]
MGSKKIKEYCKSRGWWFDDTTKDYENALLGLNIDLDTDFAKFYLHVEDGPTFYSRKREIYQICWFIINSDYTLDIKRTHEALHLPKEYIPLDSFEGGYGFYYNRNTHEVLNIELGKSITEFYEGRITPQWKGFNTFIEWFFELEN